MSGWVVSSALSMLVYTVREVPTVFAARRTLVWWATR